MRHCFFLEQNLTFRIIKNFIYHTFGKLSKLVKAEFSAALNEYKLKFLRQHAV